MRMRTEVVLCIFVLFLFGVTALAPEAAKAASLRDEMIAKAKQEGELVIGGSNADQMRDKLAGFKKLYPFITIKAFVGNTSDTINRITAEAKAGKLSVDVPDLSSDGLELLAKSHLLAKQEWLHSKDIPPDTQPSHGLYLQLFMNPRVQGVYNTKLVSPKDKPKSWEDMLDPKWNGKTMISRSSEDLAAQLAYIWRKGKELNWDRAFDFMTKLAKQQPSIARGYRGGTEQIAAGEALIFWLTSVGPAGRMAEAGAPIGLIAFPKFPASYRSYGVLKGARHPAAGWLFIDYISSPEGQWEYTDVISAKVPVNKKAKPGRLAKWLVEQNATVENSEAIDAEALFDDKVQKKSETFFLKLIGVK